MLVTPSRSLLILHPPSQLGGPLAAVCLCLFLFRLPTLPTLKPQEGCHNDQPWQKVYTIDPLLRALHLYVVNLQNFGALFIHQCCRMGLAWLHVVCWWDAHVGCALVFGVPRDMATVWVMADRDGILARERV